MQDKGENMSKDTVHQDVTHMEIAVWKARTSLVEWGSDAQSVEDMSDDMVLMIALTVAGRQELRYKAGLDWREPCA